MLNAFTSEDYAKQSPSFNEARQRWTMLDSRCENLLCLFDSEAQALEFKRVSLRQLIDREQWQIKQDNAKREADQKRAEYLASFNGFLSSNPMRAGKQLATLESGSIGAINPIRARKSLKR